MNKSKGITFATLILHSGLGQRGSFTPGAAGPNPTAGLTAAGFNFYGR